MGSVQSQRQKTADVHARQSARHDNGRQKSPSKKKKNNNISLKKELILLGLIGVFFVLFLGNFGFAGRGDTGGNYISSRLFGLFGLLQYILPIYFIISFCFCFANKRNYRLYLKITSTFLVIVILCSIIELLRGTANMNQSFANYYESGRTEVFSGGAIGGCLANFLYQIFGIFASIVILTIIIIACIVFVTERSFLTGLGSKGKKMYEAAMDDRDYRRETAEKRREERLLQRREERHEKERETYQGNRRRKIANGMTDITFSKPKKRKKNNEQMDEIHEVFSDNGSWDADIMEDNVVEMPSSFTIQRGDEISEVSFTLDRTEALAEPFEQEAVQSKQPANLKKNKPASKKQIQKQESEETVTQLAEEMQRASEQKNVHVESPSIELLKKGKAAFQESDEFLSKTGLKLQQTLQSFGVNVTVLNVSCGPSVTRYELQPDQGVKVSRIVSLADDIKLNLAVTDIRIEAPIPGKAAVGIEIPNRETCPVMLRELLESQEFSKHPSPITFAVGKDISGKVIVADIARMPHLLIAGATGSGKSVCINTLIMSILYKANPDKVKLIMIDPKVVELSVYNGIPHMFIPVVTDPKKAAGALNWAVSEMTDRYKKFADFNVRDLKGYNAKIEKLPDDAEDKPQALPQIVIIVDELADLMMVSKNEVEDAICRLAQLARAAGIHLIIATQRPSVDVITGLIKANMPSRIAFAVSSGVDSRTIIDIHGAEKLLGRGDMLFYPSGYPKPVRVQGAFISDKEVSDVVRFLVDQNPEVDYNQEIEERMNTVQKTIADHNETSNDYDDYFVQAGKFVIEKEKGSIGMLQRVFKIGFNRAARIMEQLEEAGVVSEEEAAKQPRRVLMSMEEFETFVGALE